MTITELESKVKEANASYSYWLDYTTSQGGVCDENITEAREDMRYWHKELAQAKRLL